MKITKYFTREYWFPKSPLTFADLEKIHKTLCEQGGVFKNAVYEQTHVWSQFAVLTVKQKILKEIDDWLEEASDDEIMETFANLMWPVKKAPAVRSGGSRAASLRSLKNSRRKKR